MSSCRVYYTETVEKKILDSVGVGRTSARKLSGNQILLPVNKDNPKLKDKDNVIKWAQRVINDIHTRFRADLVGTLLHMDIDKYPGAVVLRYTIPSKLIDYYENRYAKSPEETKKPIINENKYNGQALVKAKMVYSIPDNIREKYWSDIRTTIEDDKISTTQFEDFIEYLKHCK